MTKALLDRDAILALAGKELPFKDVPVPEWGGSVRIRSMTAAERDRWEDDQRKRDENTVENIRARFIAACAVREDGTLLFTDAGDVEKLGGMAIKPIQRLFNAAMRFNGLTNDDFDELVKNS